MKNRQSGPSEMRNRDSPGDDAANSHIVFLRRQVVEKRTGLSRSAIYAAISRDEFPKQITIGAKSVAWVEAEVTAWMLEKMKQRP